MQENFVQQAFAQRIGGAEFGKDTKIYKFEKIKRAKLQAQKAHPDIELIDMGVGEPDEMAFAQVVDQLCIEAARWENRMYTDNGVMAFREAVRDYMDELFKVSLNPETEIVHCIGLKSALAILPACFINPGDICIMTTPGYPVLGTWSEYLGGEVVKLPLTKERNFFPDLESLSDDQRRRAKLLYLNYPNNPTGASASKEQYQQAIDFCTKHEILIVCDAAYASLNFVGKPLSILSLPGGKEVALELHSMSKGFNMTGWRLGWVCGNPLAVSAFANVKDNADSGQFAAIQKAAIAALRDQAQITPRISKKYRRRLQVLTDILNEVGFDARVPQGSFFLYVEIPKATKSGVIFETAEAFSQWLIKEKLISTVPWDDAGHFVRFSATFIAPTEEAEQRVLGDVARRLRDVEFVF